jgi:membrane fusion protein (multidrug efflux system)
MNDSVAAPATAPPRADAEAPPSGPGPRQRIKPLVYGVLAVVLLLIICLYFLVPHLWEQWTDDAYVEAHIVSVAPKVAAYVTVLRVDDNVRVKAGELLVELDVRDFQNAVDLARANLAAAVGRLQEAEDDVQVADQNVRQQDAELRIAQVNDTLAGINLKRLLAVSDIRAVSSTRVDDQRTQFEASSALVTESKVKVDAAHAQAALARSRVVTATAARQQAQAGLAQAQLNLSYTRITAPEDGYVASKTVEAGDYVEPGRSLFSLVPARPYIIANYRETQVTHMRPGQPVVISVDSFPGIRFRGHVDSLQAGTGSRFALLPPQNATGNFVKIAQRVPVKILFDESDARLRWIVPGMSCETQVFVAKRPWLLGFLP